MLLMGRNSVRPWTMPKMSASSQFMGGFKLTAAARPDKDGAPP